jgi:hypothetical protein
MEESKNMEHWWSDTDKKLQYYKKNLSQCHFDHHKSHYRMAWDQTWTSAVTGWQLMA